MSTDIAECSIVSDDGDKRIVVWKGSGAVMTYFTEHSKYEESQEKLQSRQSVSRRRSELGISEHEAAENHRKKTHYNLEAENTPGQKQQLSRTAQTYSPCNILPRTTLAISLRKV
jgi:hypothetical protein